MPLILPRIFQQKIILEFLKEFRNILTDPTRLAEASLAYGLIPGGLQAADSEVFDSDGMFKKSKAAKEEKGGDSDDDKNFDPKVTELLSTNVGRIHGRMLDLRMMEAPTATHRSATHRSAYILNVCAFEASAILASLKLTPEDFPDLPESSNATVGVFIGGICNVQAHSSSVDKDSLNTTKSFLQGEALWYGIIPILQVAKQTGLELPDGKVSDEFMSQLDANIKKRIDCIKQLSANGSADKYLESEEEDARSSQVIKRMETAQSERSQKQNAREAAKRAEKVANPKAPEAKDSSNESESESELYIPDSARKRVDGTPASALKVEPAYYLPSAHKPIDGNPANALLTSIIHSMSDAPNILPVDASTPGIEISAADQKSAIRRERQTQFEARNKAESHKKNMRRLRWGMGALMGILGVAGAALIATGVLAPLGAIFTLASAYGIGILGASAALAIGGAIVAGYESIIKGFRGIKALIGGWFSPKSQQQPASTVVPPLAPPIPGASSAPQGQTSIGDETKTCAAESVATKPASTVVPPLTLPIASQETDRLSPRGAKMAAIKRGREQIIEKSDEVGETAERTVSSFAKIHAVLAAKSSTPSNMPIVPVQAGNAVESGEIVSSSTTGEIPIMPTLISQI